MSSELYRAFSGGEEMTFLDFIVKMNHNYEDSKEIIQDEPIYNINNTRILVSVEKSKPLIKINEGDSEKIEDTKSKLEEKLEIKLEKVEN